MTNNDFLLELYCLVDENLKYVMPPQGLRPHGPEPTLADAETLTIEIAGEYWSLDTDKAQFEFFRQYHRAEFPALAKIDRTTFARQAANLWLVAERLRQHLVLLLPMGLRDWSLFDSVTLRVCSFARAPRCRLFAGLASFGYDHLEKTTFYGFKLHLCCGIGGPVASCQIAPANVPDVDMVPETKPPEGGIGLGDRAYWDPQMQQDLKAEGFWLIAPFRKRTGDPYPALAHAVSRLRQTIETTISQFAERFNAKWTWARDQWHLCHRVIRKILAHTACIVLTLRHGYPPLQLERLMD